MALNDEYYNRRFNQTLIESEIARIIAAGKLSVERRRRILDIPKNRNFSFNTGVGFPLCAQIAITTEEIQRYYGGLGSYPPK